MDTQNGAAVRAALDAHNAVRRYELADERHAVEMLLADLIAWADEQEPRADFDALVSTAREIVANS